MNEGNDLGKNYNKNIKELKNLFDELTKDLNSKLGPVYESKEILEVLESYKLKIQLLSNSVVVEEE